jgi:hypothetical protein
MPVVRLRRYARTPYLRRQTLTRLMFADMPPPPVLSQPNAKDNVGFLAVEANQCREIVGHDGLAIFCGAPVKPTYSFCEYHHNINYRPRGGEPCGVHSNVSAKEYSQPEAASSVTLPSGNGASVEAEHGPTAILSAPDSSVIAA